MPPQGIDKEKTSRAHLTREERVARVRQIERREKTRRYARWGAYGVLALLVIAGAGYGISLLPKEPNQVHWHAKYQIHVDGQLVNMANPRFNGMAYADAHIHAPDYDLIHNEGTEGRGTLGAFFAYQLGGKLSDDEMVIPAGTSRSGEFKANGTETLRLFVSNQPQKKDWTEIPSGFYDVEFRDADRLLIMYGNYTDDQIYAAEAAFPDFAGPGQNAQMPTASTKP